MRVREGLENLEETPPSYRREIQTLGVGGARKLEWGNTLWWGEEGEPLDRGGRGHHTVGRRKSGETRRNHLRRDLKVAKEGG